MMTMAMMMSTTTTTTRVCSMMSIMVTAAADTVMVFATGAMLSVMIMMMMMMMMMIMSIAIVIMMSIDAVIVRFAFICALILFPTMFAFTALVLVYFLKLYFIICIHRIRTVRFVAIYILVLLCFSNFVLAVLV